MARGGSQQIADALVGGARGSGRPVECDHRVESLSELPRTDAVLLDVTPRQVIGARRRCAAEPLRQDARPSSATGRACSRSTGRSTARSRGPTPTAPGRRPCTSVARSTRSPRPKATSRPAGSPSAPTCCSRSRACSTRAARPPGTQTAWAYCHVPNGSTVDMTDRIEAQVERFAPGFRDRIVGRHTMNTAAMEAHDANYIGGDINGGVADLRQFVARPKLGLHPWKTPLDGVYLCSSSTPAGRRRPRHVRLARRARSAPNGPVMDISRKVVMAPPTARQVARWSGDRIDAKLSPEEERCPTKQPSGSA